jgi:hypothetical protein
MFRFAVIFKLLFNDFWIFTERAYGDIRFCVIHLSGVGGGKKYAWASDFPGKFFYTFGGEFHHVGRAERESATDYDIEGKTKQKEKNFGGSPTAPWQRTSITEHDIIVRPAPVFSPLVMWR